MPGEATKLGGGDMQTGLEHQQSTDLQQVSVIQRRLIIKSGQVKYPASQKPYWAVLWVITLEEGAPDPQQDKKPQNCPVWFDPTSGKSLDST